ncbi:MAG: carcinine hydrolase/isopenicillin-N N-acyltransferase family protein [Burkholderiales bacterium]|nr:carcinine hydrolase/isopenicillin-N N-acyltransferase family protein [Burkholderiales bacterium]
MKKLTLILATLPIFGMACTTFASFNGVNNSFVIAKNRDNNPDRQIIQVVNEPTKYKYIALSRQDVPDFVSAGVNEHNLAVFNEVTIEYSDKAVGGIADDFSKDILQNYKTVKDVIPNIDKLVNKYPDPVFYQVTDGKYLLSIEVAPDKKYSYNLTSSEAYAHTNNYQIKSLIKDYPYTESEKQRLAASSTRYDRATFLMKQNKNLDLAQMQLFALDRNAGNDDSIFRTGAIDNNPRTSKSLAFFGVSQDKTGKAAATVNANLYNMGEKYNYTLLPSFWNQFESQFTILKPNAK